MFFAWYNNEPYHSGISLLTPYMMHYGHVEQVVQRRSDVLADAYALHRNGL